MRRNPSPLFDWPQHRSTVIAFGADGVAFALAGISIVLGVLGLLSPDDGAGFAVFFILGMLIIASGLVAIGAGLMAILRDGERSIIMLVSIVIGGLLSWFLFFEIFVGHK